MGDKLNYYYYHEFRVESKDDPEMVVALLTTYIREGPLYLKLPEESNSG